MHLILFFNGWGMNHHIIDKLICDDCYKVYCIDYPYLTDHIDFSKYEKIYVIGWSFGVHYASNFLLKNRELNCLSIAINGVPYIIGKYGISPKMFKLTLETLSKDNLKKFYENMGLPLEYFHETPDLDRLKIELEDILFDFPNTHHTFDKVFLGKYDRIIPYSKQLKFYEKESTAITILQCGHYPFEIIENWRDIIDQENEF
ncbi:pimeloyl-ACP methyl esterase BioG family protein [Cetobacterium sp.]